MLDHPRQLNQPRGLVLDWRLEVFEAQTRLSLDCAGSVERRRRFGFGRREGLASRLCLRVAIQSGVALRLPPQSKGDTGRIPHHLVPGINSVWTKRWFFSSIAWT